MALLLAGLTGLSAAASAAPPIGCDPKVQAAIVAKAQAMVAYDVAVTREIIDRPPSIMELTCFSRPTIAGDRGSIAGISASEGGKVFSGDFTRSLKTVLTDLRATPASGARFRCTRMQKFWENTVMKQGIDRNIPYPDLGDLRTGVLPGGVPAEFKAGWNAAKAADVFKNFDKAYKDLETAQQGQPVPDFTNTRSSCDVLHRMGFTTCP